MADAFILLSHTLSPDVQEKELYEIFHINKIHILPQLLQNIWGQINVDFEYQVDLSYILAWLDSKTLLGDYICVQGEWGLVYAVVSWAVQNGRIPIYASSERCAIEERDNNGDVRKTSSFRHRRFTLYECPWKTFTQNNEEEKHESTGDQ